MTDDVAFHSAYTIQLERAVGEFTVFDVAHTVFWPFDTSASYAVIRSEKGVQRSFQITNGINFGMIVLPSGTSESCACDSILSSNSHSFTEA